MPDPQDRKASDAMRRFGSSLRSLARRVANGPLRQTGTADGRAPGATSANRPVVPLINLRRSLGRAAVGCENQDVCGGTIELALYEHTATNSDVGETTVIEATMIEQTCSCDLSDDERERVLDRAREAIRMRGKQR